MAASASTWSWSRRSGPVYQAGTLSANPVAMCAGLATLQELTSGAVYLRLEELGRQLETALAAAGVHVQRAGSIFWIPGAPAAALLRRPDDVDASVTGRYPALFRALMATEIYLPPSPLEVGFLSMAHDDGHVRGLAEAVVAASGA